MKSDGKKVETSLYRML